MTNLVVRCNNKNVISTCWAPPDTERCNLMGVRSTLAGDTGQPYSSALSRSLALMLQAARQCQNAARSNLETQSRPHIGTSCKHLSGPLLYIVVPAFLHRALQIHHRCSQREWSRGYTRRRTREAEVRRSIEAAHQAAAPWLELAALEAQRPHQPHRAPGPIKGSQQLLIQRKDAGNGLAAYCTTAGRLSASAMGCMHDGTPAIGHTRQTRRPAHEGRPASIAPLHTIVGNWSANPNCQAACKTQLQKTHGDLVQTGPSAVEQVTVSYPLRHMAIGWP